TIRLELFNPNHTGTGIFDEVTVNVVSPPPSGEDFWLEAECGEVGSGWTTVDDTSVSNGQYLIRSLGNSFSPPNSEDGMVSFDLAVSTAGTYRVYGLVSVPSGNDDSFWIRANGSSWISWNSIPGSNAFEWHQFHSSPNGPAFVTYVFDVGMNTIDIGYREDGAALDKIYITRIGPEPMGQGEAAQACGTLP
ncbi:hypothetical protein ABV409_16675, partial [Flagellimonas sp. DF-77]|uniref:hypothetical protein n=1 Tax=Flagellimonas algarum TaxID=3230298 RepID=UPI003396B792